MEPDLNPVRSDAKSQPRGGKPKKANPLREKIDELKPKHERVDQRPVLRLKEGEKDVKRVESEPEQVRNATQLVRQHKAFVAQETEPQKPLERQGEQQLA